MSGYYAMGKTDTFMYLGDVPFELKEEQGSNTPISKNVSISGEYNVVGCKGFKILDAFIDGFGNSENPSDTGKYYLNSVEGLCVGDIYSVIFDSYYINLGEIKSIDITRKSVTVTNFIDEMNNNPNDNILFIVSKPFLGTEDIGQLANASGINSSALLMGASAGGKLTKAIGRFSKTSGLRTVAEGYGSIADGAGTVATRNYQRVAGLYNIRDKEKRYLDIVGNGKNDDKRSNAYTLDEEGNGEFSGTVTGKDLIINSKLGSITIYGNTKMQEGDSASAYVKNITLDGKSYPFPYSDVELNSMTNVVSDETTRDELIIGRKVKRIKKIKKIVLGDNIGDTSVNNNYFYQGTNEDGTQFAKEFFFDLRIAKDVNGNPLLTPEEKEMLDSKGQIFKVSPAYCTHYDDVLGTGRSSYWLDTRAASSTKESKFRIYFYDENAVDIRNNLKKHTYYTKEEIQAKIDAGEISGYDIRTLPIVFYFVLLEPVEESLEGNYSIEWNNFIAKYNNNSEVIANGEMITQNSKITEDCILNSKSNPLSITEYIDDKFAELQAMILEG